MIKNVLLFSPDRQLIFKARLKEKNCHQNLFFYFTLPPDSSKKGSRVTRETRDQMSIALTETQEFYELEESKWLKEKEKRPY